MVPANFNLFIPPFPDDIHRDQFGHWLSGFVDGEGSFSAIWKNRRYRIRSSGEERIVKCPDPTFRINLRADDFEVLSLIRSFLGCGTLSFPFRKPRGGEKQVVAFIVSGTKNAVRHIIPNFEKYPLRAKKRGDFDIWKQAVHFADKMAGKPRIGRGKGGGTISRWTEEDIKTYDDLVNCLKKYREYIPPRELT